MIMASHYTFTIQGKPITKLRPRFRRFGGTYDVQSDLKKAVKLQMAGCWNHPLIAGPLSLDIRFFMPIPKSTSKKNRAKMISGEIPHTKTPDLDNILKWAADCMTGIVYQDDRQIIEIHATKQYTDTEGCTVIGIKEKDPPNE